MVCSSQPVWAPLPEAALPPWEACDLQLPLPSVELPLAQPGWAPSPFGDATIALPPLPSLPLPPLPPLPALPAAAAASQLLDASSAESERSAKLEQRLEKMRAKNRRAQARYREKQKVGGLGEPPASLDSPGMPCPACSGSQLLMGISPVPCVHSLLVGIQVHVNPVAT